MAPGKVVVLDIGGTKISAGVLEETGIESFRQALTPAQEGPEPIMTTALELVSDLLEGAVALRVAATGLVRDGRVTTLNQKTFPGWTNFPLEQRLHARTALSVAVMNDAQAAAWGEHQRGAGKNTGTFAFLTVSTGIGGGLVVNGRPLVGASGLAGHVGYSLPRSGDPTVLEFLASGTAIATIAGEHRHEATSTKAVFAAATAGEAWARALVSEVAATVAVAIANLKVLIDPEVVAIGGGVGLAPGFVTAVADALSSQPPLYHLPVVAAQLGSHAGLIGAGLWERSALHAPGR